MAQSSVSDDEGTPENIMSRHIVMILKPHALLIQKKKAQMSNAKFSKGQMYELNHYFNVMVFQLYHTGVSG